jgi:lipoic acid synthetase
MKALETKIRMPGRPSDLHAVKVRLKKARLHTVCEEAKCPNIYECFGAQTATFLIMGNICTRNCRFCGISKNRTPKKLDPNEPQRVAETVRDLKLEHAVVTSVSRDDLADRGVSVFIESIRRIRALCPNTTIEVLIPDFDGNPKALGQVLDEYPHVLNHNVETVRRLYPRVRPEGNFDRSLQILAQSAECGHSIVKSGFMVGLGEKDKEVFELLEFLHHVGCQVVTIGQYLRPNKQSLPVDRIVIPSQFESFKNFGEKLGLLVLAGALVRSSYRAREILQAFQSNANKNSYFT